MDRVEHLLPGYTALLSRYALSADPFAREGALIDATELGKSALGEGPAIDLMHELHGRAQAKLAGRWHEAAPGSAEQHGRERLVRGEALPLMLALQLPHELATMAHHEQRWRREHETLVAMFEQTDDLIAVLDVDGQCDDVNPAFCRSTGWTRREAVEGAGAWSDPPQGAHAQRRRTQQRRRDGSSLVVDWSISPILGRRGELLSHVCIGRDIDRQQKIDDGLRENDKLRAIATLAGGIAHDFNNLLGSIIGLTELCELEAVAGSRQARNLGRIQQASAKAAALVRQMLDFSRQTPPALQRVELAEWLGPAEVLLRAAMPRHQRLEVEVRAGGPIQIDPIQMEQVLLNLVRNAAQAMGDEGGRVQIVADHAEPSAGGGAGHDRGRGGQPAAPASAAAHLRLRIIDSGSGIAPDLLGKIFEPFFTTKPIGEGTGLGLAAVHGIVTSHGGVIEVDSDPGMGTTFSLYLPLAGGGDAAGGQVADSGVDRPTSRSLN